jgi:hypothetical protein
MPRGKRPSPKFHERSFFQLYTFFRDHPSTHLVCLFDGFRPNPCSAIWYASKIVPEEPLHSAGEVDVFGDALSINMKVRFGQPKMVSIQRVC